MIKITKKIKYVPDFVFFGHPVLRKERHTRKELKFICNLEKSWREGQFKNEIQIER